jgi:hypothetical protein
MPSPPRSLLWYGSYRSRAVRVVLVREPGSTAKAGYDLAPSGEHRHRGTAPRPNPDTVYSCEVAARARSAGPVSSPITPPTNPARNPRSTPGLGKSGRVEAHKSETRGRTSCRRWCRACRPRCPDQHPVMLSGQRRLLRRRSGLLPGAEAAARGAPRAELDADAAWIRHESDRYRRECTRLGLPYVDVGGLGFEAAMVEARRELLGRRAAIRPWPVRDRCGG